MSATTTAVVTELDITRAQYVELVRSALERGGWPGEWAEGDVTELQYAAERFDLGDVLERSGMVVRRRFDPVTGELLDWRRVDR